MPYLQITTNVPVKRTQKALIDEAVAKALIIVPKERPEFLMTNYEDAASMLLSGDSAKPCAMAELRVLSDVFTTNDPNLFETLMSVLTEILSRVLEIDKDRIYVTVTGSHMWAAGEVNILKGILK